MKPLTPRERKLVAVALLLAALALAWLALIAPVFAGFAAREARAQDLALRHAQNERLIARIPQLRRAAEAQARQRAVFALVAAGPVPAGELLKERLEAALVAGGGELRGSEVVETRAGWVRASASGVVSNDQLVAWLGRLSTQQPYLVLESLSVGADRTINSNRADLMDVKLEASIPLAAANPR